MSPSERHVRVGAWAMGLAVAASGVALVALAAQVDRRWVDVHMTPHFCVEQPGQLLRGTLLRWTGIAVGVLLVILAPRAARWANRRTAGHVAGAVIRIVLAAALALVVSDGVLRLVYKEPAGPPVLHFEPDSEGDPLLLYRPVPSHVTEKVAGGRHLRFVIDANDWRVRSTDDVVDFTRPTVIFTGESTAAGFGLDYDDTYPFHVAQELGVQPVNVAVQGYGNDGAYLRLHDALPRFQHVVATVTLINQTMIERNTWPDRAHLVVGPDGSSRLEPARDVDGWFARSPLRRLASHLVHSDEALLRARAYIEATARETRAQGGVPLFVLTNLSYFPPCLPDATGAPSLDRNLFEGLDVLHVRVDLTKDTYDTVIGHPNPEAHAQLARAITAALREHGVTGH